MHSQDECIDDLGIKSLKIIQKNKGFKFGTDAVLLSDFAKNSDADCILDLCTGSGIIPILLSAKTNAGRICAVEIQEDVADMAKRSVKLNNLQDRIEIVCADLKNAHYIYGKKSFDAITCNPPYMKVGTGLQNPNSSKLISRHEVMATLSDVIVSARKLLREHGHFFMVHRPNRLVDIMYTMRENKIEPKRIRFVYPRHGFDAILVLVEGVYLGKGDIKIESPLYIYNENGGYTNEMNKIYNKEPQI